jgi:hypothetical protein
MFFYFSKILFMLKVRVRIAVRVSINIRAQDTSKEAKHQQGCYQLLRKNNAATTLSHCFVITMAFLTAMRPGLESAI